jgi:orotidine-5'-phosphate decarboxylase
MPASNQQHRFSEILASAIASQGSSLCCGLDPDPTRLPKELQWSDRRDEAVIEFLKAIVDVTFELVCCYKIQKAYFDLLDAPKAGLVAVIDYIKLKTAVPIILDAKIGEIDSSMAAYVKFCADHIRASALVVNPYMGDEVFHPFRNQSLCGGLVLVRTSNPGANIIQDRRLEGGERLWEAILNMVGKEWEIGSDLIPILASTADVVSSRTLTTLPSGLPIFVAGFGAQKGSIELIRYLQGSDHPIAVNSSRDIIFAFEKNKDKDWQSSIADAAHRSRALIHG